jgi:8-oxo-dGTP pyrophosphatase MutT (NUDIX family)
MIRPFEKHATSTVYILTDSQPRKALMILHKKHGVWVPPGGHQESLENSYEAAIREVQEETGLDITPYLQKPKKIDDRHSYLPLPRMLCEHLVPAHGDDPAHYHLDMEYVVYMPELAPTHNVDEAHDARWVRLDELDQLETFADIRHFLSKELAE